MKKIILSVGMVLMGIFSFAQQGQPFSDRVTVGCEELYLHGINIAWVNFARDVGTNPEFGDVHPNMTEFNRIFDEAKAAGSNSIRWWLHTNGSFSPSFDQNDLTSGYPSFFIDDIKLVLDAAWERGMKVQICLWSFDMLKTNWLVVPERNKKLLVEDEAIQAYINNALIPMVEGLKDHPGLLAWEIFNEPEGMTLQYAAGWDGFAERVTMTEIQKFINLCAGAIHRADPDALVTNGSWAFIAHSDVGGNTNYYTDARLIAAGGDQDGYLDFYNVHYYNWAASSLSPFHNPASHWNLDKPVVIAEFHAEVQHGVQPNGLSQNLFENGYAGGLLWSATDSHSPNMYTTMNQLYAIQAAKEAIDINPTACGGALFRVSSNSICQSETITVTDLSSTAVSWSWNFGAGATPATFNGQTPPAISYSTAGEKTISLLIVDDQNQTHEISRTLTVKSSTSSYTVTISSDNIADCSEEVNINLTISPSLEASQSTVIATPAKTAWDDGSTQNEFIINNDGTIDGMANASQYILGNWHNWSDKEVSFVGMFGNNAKVTATIVNVNTEFSSPRLTVYIDDEAASQVTLTENQLVEVDIPAGQHTIRFANTGDEWLQISRYEFEGLGVDLSYAWYVNDVFVEGVNSTSYTAILNRNDEIYATVETGELEACVSSILTSNTLINDCVLFLKGSEKEESVAVTNPFQDQLFVDFNGIIIVSMPDGREVERVSARGTNTRLGASIPTGMYLLTFVNDEIQFTTKVVKQ